MRALKSFFDGIDTWIMLRLFARALHMHKAHNGRRQEALECHGLRQDRLATRERQTQQHECDRSDMASGAAHRIAVLHCLLRYGASILLCWYGTTQVS